jgi:thiamine biosynthesis lipoprotein ApbE
MYAETVARHLAAMGTALALTVSAPTRDLALRASEAAVREIERLEALLSTWRTDTPLARLNAAAPGVAAPVPPELFALLKRVFEWEKTTDGAFDPAVLPLVTAWGLRTGGRIPDATSVTRARAASRASLFTLEESSSTVTRHDALAGIDEGAWGKGWALDRAADALRAAGSTSFVLDLGGQVLASGGDETTIAVAHPRDRSRVIALLRLKDVSASTSGNSERGLVVNGRRVGHLLDPRTGEPAPDFGSVTVVAPSAFVADVLSTAFFVLGPEAGLALSERLRAGGVAHETLFFSEGEGEQALRVSMSPGMKNLVSPARAEETPKPADPATELRLKELEQKLDVLTKEIEALRIGESPSAAPSPAAPTASATATPVTAEAAASRFGLGPAAARVYARKGVSVGGYGEALYQSFASSKQDGAPSGGTDTIDLSRAVLYFGYKFDDHFVFNSEVEYEHAVAASDKQGEVEVEFAYVDWLSPSHAFRARAGLLLVPMGFLNELHEPPTFFGARRNDVETLILPTTWRELGFGAYGEAGPLTYRLFLVSGLNSEGYTAEGIREGRQEGSLAKARDFALTGRLDFVGVNGLLAGASFFTGCSGQGRTTASGETVCGRTTVWDLHADFRWRGFSLRALVAGSTISDAAAINELNGFSGDEGIGSRQRGWYAEAGFDVLTLVPRTRFSLIPFVRYEAWNTQAAVPDGFSRDLENDASQWTAGVVFKPIPQVVLKFDGQWRKNSARTGVNQVNVALGYEF